MTDQYYREEYGYLVEEGREFARLHPDLAARLNLEDSRGRDPNVERLLEGFAFLTSRIRKRLDDDFPELAEGILSLIWPHHGSPLPSFCLLEFSAAGGGVMAGVDVPRGAEVESQPVGKGLRCRYRSCSDLTVFPIALTSAKAEALGSASRLGLTFKVNPGADASAFARKPLRVQFHGELGICHQLFNLLLGLDGPKRFLQRVNLTASHKEGEASFQLGPESVRPAGLTPSESLLPMGEASLWSFNLLLDYFLFQEKFQAFWLDGLAPLADLQGLTEFELSFFFNHPWPQGARVSPREFRLNCVPAANLFQTEGEPIRLDQLRSSYKVLVDTQNNEFYQVYSVDRVEGMALADGKRRRYQPFMAARRPLEDEAEGLEGPYYALSRKPSPWEGLDVHLSLVDPLGKGGLPPVETISLSLTCTNGVHGSEPLPGQIDQPIIGVPEGLRVSNLSQPTAPAFPKPGGKSLWNWLSHASLNYLNMASASRMRMMLRLMEQKEDEANLRRIQGVQSAKLERERRLIQGSLVTGNKLTLSLEEDHFSSLGDVQIFARVLSSFLEAYASINSFIMLEVLLSTPGKRIAFDRIQGAAGSL